MRKNGLNPDFFLNAIPEPNSGCWLWERAAQVDGYGNVWRDGRCQLAHRVAYELHYQCCVLPAYEVCHTCDTPACINPGHLFLTTHTGNMRDRSIKGRWRGKGPLKRAMQWLDRKPQIIYPGQSNTELQANGGQT